MLSVSRRLRYLRSIPVLIVLVLFAAFLVTSSLLADGANVGTFNATDKSWSPGQGASYTFTIPAPALNPFSLPAKSNLVLSVTAQVSAGIASAQVTSSDSSVQSFGNTSC